MNQTSIVASIYEHPDYVDRYITPVSSGRFESVDAVATAWFTSQPALIRILSTNTLRRKSIIEAIGDGRYEPGTAIGSWDVIERDDNEIVFGDDLGFMQFRFSFRLTENATQIEAATAVKFLWRRTGALYFALVRPLHPPFVRFLLTRIGT